VEDGEEIVIARNGTPVAKLVPHVEERKPREPGWAKGRIVSRDPVFERYSVAVLRA
jgi:antitoxin (DNA-binding transcriptional repressor) of toxin-antitoxin stability system